MSGWIKYHRSIENWEWYDDAYTLKLFLYIISNANIEDKRWHGIEVKKGQLITSTGKLADKLKMSEKMVYSRLLKLHKTGEITRKGENKYTLLTVVKYDDFQHNDTVKVKQKEIKSKSKGKQKETTKEVKKLRSKEYIYPNEFEFRKEAYTQIVNSYGEEAFTPKVKGNVISKYNSWVADDWHDGYGKKIKNWKSKIGHSLKHFISQ